MRAAFSTVWLFECVDIDVGPAAGFPATSLLFQDLVLFTAADTIDEYAIARPAVPHTLSTARLRIL